MARQPDVIGSINEGSPWVWGLGVQGSGGQGVAVGVNCCNARVCESTGMMDWELGLEG